MARKLTTKGKVQEMGLTIPEKPCSTEERDKLEKWSMMASLVVFKGNSMAQAYRLVYDEPMAGDCPASIRNSHKFRSLLTRLRNAQGLTDDEVKGTLEGLYHATVNDEEQPIKARLQAAAQWQKLRGLEKIKEVQAVDEGELIWRQAMSAKKKTIDAEVVSG
jgi:hypothetical protein